MIHMHTSKPKTTAAPSDAGAAADDDGDAARRREQAAKEEEEYDATVEELRAFLQTHIEDLRLHPPTTYELLASHGRKQVRTCVRARRWWMCHCCCGSPN